MFNSHIITVSLLLSLLSISMTVLSGTTKIPLSYHEQGRAIYNYRCYFCHGYSGDAKTLTSSYVNPTPRNFTKTTLASLSRDKMLNAVSHGKPGTAMTSFSRLLTNSEIAAVVDFIRDEFMKNKRRNSRYHINANGWPNHARYAPAFDYATGKLALDQPENELTKTQRNGKRLFLSSCISCHDRSNFSNEKLIWKKQAVSYPRNNYSHSKIDIVSSASIYAKHSISPSTATLSPEAKVGKILWLQNCAFCHAADGSGQNWIGSFLEPPPRDLRQASFMATMSRKTLTQRIRNGLTNSSMPAWKNVLSAQQIEQIISYISIAFYPINNTPKSH